MVHWRLSLLAALSSFIPSYFALLLRGSLHSNHYCRSHLAMSAKTVEVQVISDFACPWCYVGKARLENAVDRFRSAHPGVQVQISFGPYMIDPATQPQGEEYMAYTRRRWGGDGWTGSLKRAGAKDGLAFAKWTTWPNSLLAHRVQKYAEEFGKADEVNSLIFQTIYERGGNASDMETLVAVAEEAGLSANSARAFLGSRQGEEAIVKEDKHAKRVMGVGGVPHFVVRGGSETRAGGADGTSRELVLEGAVAPDSILQALSSVHGSMA